MFSTKIITQHNKLIDAVLVNINTNILKVLSTQNYWMVCLLKINVSYSCWHALNHILFRQASASVCIKRTHHFLLRVSLIFSSLTSLPLCSSWSAWKLLAWATATSLTDQVRYNSHSIYQFSLNTALNQGTYTVVGTYVVTSKSKESTSKSLDMAWDPPSR